MRLPADQANVDTRFLEPCPNETADRTGTKYHDRLGHGVQLT
jgi:hypothetical protein